MTFALLATLSWIPDPRRLKGLCFECYDLTPGPAHGEEEGDGKTFEWARGQGCTEAAQAVAGRENGGR